MAETGGISLNRKLEEFTEKELLLRDVQKTVARAVDGLDDAELWSAAIRKATERRETHSPGEMGGLARVLGTRGLYAAWTEGGFESHTGRRLPEVYVRLLRDPERFTAKRDEQIDRELWTLGRAYLDGYLASAGVDIDRPRTTNDDQQLELISEVMGTVLSYDDEPPEENPLADHPEITDITRRTYDNGQLFYHPLRLSPAIIGTPEHPGGNRPTCLAVAGIMASVGEQQDWAHLVGIVTENRHYYNYREFKTSVEDIGFSARTADCLLPRKVAIRIQNNLDKAQESSQVDAGFHAVNLIRLHSGAWVMVDSFMHIFTYLSEGESRSLDKQYDQIHEQADVYSAATLPFNSQEQQSFHEALKVYAKGLETRSLSQDHILRRLDAITAKLNRPNKRKKSGNPAKAAQTTLIADIAQEFIVDVLLQPDDEEWSTYRTYLEESVPTRIGQRGNAQYLMQRAVQLIEMYGSHACLDANGEHTHGGRCGESCIKRSLTNPIGKATLAMLLGSAPYVFLMRLGGEYINTSLSGIAPDTHRGVEMGDPVSLMGGMIFSEFANYYQPGELPLHFWPTYLGPQAPTLIHANHEDVAHDTMTVNAINFWRTLPPHLIDPVYRDRLGVVPDRRTL